MEVNYFAPAMLTKLFLPALKKSEGTIALVSSMASQFCPPYRSGYAASKAAIDTLMDVLRIELGGDSKVHIVKLFPGFVDTNIRNHAVGVQEDVNYDSKRMMSVGTAADRILYAVAIGKRNDLFDPLAGTLAAVRFLFPSLADRIVSSAVKKVRKKDE
jgi:short-subunit dehydrogenase